MELLESQSFQQMLRMLLFMTDSAHALLFTGILINNRIIGWLISDPIFFP